MGLLTHLCLLAVLALLASPAFAQRPVPVTDAGTYVQFKGFRIKPPAGAHWWQIDRNQENVFFGRKIEARVHTFAALVISGTLPDSEPVATIDDYFALVKRIKRASIQPARHKFLEEEYSFESVPGPTCIRYRLKAEDTGAPQAPGIPLILEMVGFSCAHPGSLKNMIDIHYSERGGPGPDSAQMRREGEEFIRSIVFTPPA